MKDARDYSPWRQAILALGRKDKAFWAWGRSKWEGAEEETEYRRCVKDVEKAFAAVLRAETEGFGC